MLVLAEVAGTPGGGKAGVRQGAPLGCCGL